MPAIVVLVLSHGQLSLPECAMLSSRNYHRMVGIRTRPTLSILCASNRNAFPLLYFVCVTNNLVICNMLLISYVRFFELRLFIRVVKTFPIRSILLLVYEKQSNWDCANRTTTLPTLRC